MPLPEAIEKVGLFRHKKFICQDLMCVLFSVQCISKCVDEKLITCNKKWEELKINYLNSHGLKLKVPSEI